MGRRCRVWILIALAGMASIGSTVLADSPKLAGTQRDLRNLMDEYQPLAQSLLDLSLREVVDTDNLSRAS